MSAKSLQKEIAELVDKGINKEYIDNLYRSENFYNQIKIAEIINDEFSPEIKATMKHVRLLMEHFGIDKWSPTEARTVQKNKPANTENIEKKATVLEKENFPVSKIEELYKSGMSKNEIIVKINNDTGKSIINKIMLKKIWEHYGIYTRTLQEDNILRMDKVNKTQRENNKTKAKYGNGYHAEELVEMYVNGMSMNEVAKKTGSNSTTISKLVKEASEKIRDSKETQNRIDRKTLELTIEELLTKGIDKEWIEKEYLNLSKVKTTELINSKFNKNVITRNSLTKILAYYGIHDKTTNQNYSKTVYGNGITKEEAIKKYSEGNSLEKMYKDYGISPTVLSRMLKEEGRELRRQKNVTDVLKDLDATGITKADFIEKYHAENRTIKEMVTWLSTLTHDRITDKTFQKMVNILEIKKPAELDKINKGRKSANELLNNLQLLKQSGFNSRQELADYYTANHRVTQLRLIDELNSKLDKDFFTIRWLERHMVPYLPAERLIGVSRGELGVREFIESFYTGKISYSNRSIISPKELDIVLPELKLAIEFNGDYWHSDKFFLENQGLTSFEYHANKLTAARVAGYQLVFVWESDWEKNTTNIEDAIKRFITSGGSNTNVDLMKLAKA